MPNFDEKTDPDVQEVVKAALMHVPFEGWSHRSFDDAVRDSGVNPSQARLLFPRGATDVAIAAHIMGDRALEAEIEPDALAAMRVRDRVTHLVRRRLELAGSQAVLRASCGLFALPHLAPEGARLIWGTSDIIWNLLQDPSRDINWYTKRATLSAVYSATVLFYVGDQSDGYAETWEFLDRRIENVMSIEKAKAQVRGNAQAMRVLQTPLSLLSRITAPQTADGMFGDWWRNGRR